MCEREVTCSSRLCLKLHAKETFLQDPVRTCKILHDIAPTTTIYAPMEGGVLDNSQISYKYLACKISLNLIVSHLVLA